MSGKFKRSRFQAGLFRRSLFESGGFGLSLFQRGRFGRVIISPLEIAPPSTEIMPHFHLLGMF
jgi:hypothetical protein